MRAFASLSLLIGGHTLLETARDALFLAKLPPSRLAIVYAVIAVLALALSAANARIVRKVGEARCLVLTLVAASAGTFALYLPPPTPLLVFGVYVWSALLSTIMVVQFWMFLARVFTPTQSKRIFGPIAAGGVIGAMIGATGAAAVLSVVPVRSLLLGAAVAFALCAVVTPTIASATSGEGAPRDSGIPADAGGPASAELNEAPPSSRSLGVQDIGSPLFRRKAYIVWFAALTALSTAALLGTDYLFKAEAVQRIPADQLGHYFAKTYAIFNAVALVIQVFVSSWLLRRLGVARTILVVPLLLLGGAGGVLLTGAPLAVMATKGVDGSLRHSLQQVTGELLGLPIPDEDRARVKPLIDGVLKRLIQAAMAGALLLLAMSDQGSPRNIAVLVLVLTLGWLVSAIAIRGPYLDMFRYQVLRGTFRAKPAEMDHSTVGALVAALRGREPASAMAAMDLLAEGGHGRFIPRRALFHKIEAVQIHALELMRRTERREWVRPAERLLRRSRSEAVRVAALRALAACGVLTAVRLAARDPSPAVRAHAVVTILSAEGEGDPMTSAPINEILTIPGDEGHKARIALLDALRDHADPRFAEVVLALARHLDPEVVERAVIAMAGLRDVRFVPVLVQHLNIRKARDDVREALVQLGEPAQIALEQALRNPVTHRAVRLHIPRTLARFENQRALDFLTEQLAIEKSRLVRYKVLRGLGRLVMSPALVVDQAAILTELRRNLVEHITILARWIPLERNAPSKQLVSGQLLIGLLSDKLRQSVERAFRALHIAYPREQIRRVFVALHSSDERGRSVAFEFIAALTSEISGDLAQETRSLLELVIDDLPAEQKVERAVLHVPGPPLDVEAALLALVHDDDRSLAALAAFHAADLGLDRVRAEATRAAQERTSLQDLTAPVLAPAAPEVEREV